MSKNVGTLSPPSSVLSAWVKRLIRTWLPIAIALGALTWLVLTVDWAKVQQALVQADPWGLLLAEVFMLLAMLTKAQRWGMLFYPRTGLRLRNLLSALFIGYMANAILPARLGEVVRGVLIGETEQVSKVQALSTIVVEKVLDLLTILLILAAIAPFVPLPGGLQGAGLTVAVVTTLGLLALLLAAAFLRDNLLRWGAGLQKRVELLQRINLVGLLDTSLAGAVVLRQGRLLPGIIGLSAVTWALSAAASWAVLLALHVNVPWQAALLVLVTTNLVAAVPSTPGYIGVFHAAVVAALLVYNADPSQAAAAAVVTHIVAFGTFIVGGLICLYLGQYRLGDLRRRALGGEDHAARPPVAQPLTDTKEF